VFQIEAEARKYGVIGIPTANSSSNSSGSGGRRSSSSAAAAALDSVHSVGYSYSQLRRYDEQHQVLASANSEAGGSGPSTYS
jgi:hypothetical protein